MENRSTQLVLFKIGQTEVELVQKFDWVDERMRSLHSNLQRVEMKMEQTLSLQHELQSTLSDFMSKVDRLVDYSQEFQQARTPKRPYITNEVGLL